MRTLPLAAMRQNRREVKTVGKSGGVDLVSSSFSYHIDTGHGEISTGGES